MESPTRKSLSQVLGQVLLGSEEERSNEQPLQHQQEPNQTEGDDGRGFHNNPLRADISSNDSSIRSFSPHSIDFLTEVSQTETALPNRGREGEGIRSSLAVKRSTSVAAILQNLAAGNTFLARGEEWKLTRAVCHLEDAFKGKFSPCPPIERERVRALFKLRWKYRGVEFLLVHLFLVLSLAETPAWCEEFGGCFWDCYPDFSRNLHMKTFTALILEGSMLSVLVALSLLDVVRYGLKRGRQNQVLLLSLLFWFTRMRMKYACKAILLFCIMKITFTVLISI